MALLSPNTTSEFGFAVNIVIGQRLKLCCAFEPLAHTEGPFLPNAPRHNKSASTSSTQATNSANSATASFLCTEGGLTLMPL